MNTTYFRTAVALLAVIASHLGAGTAHAEGQSRAEYLNVSALNNPPNSSTPSATQLKNPGVASFGGYLKGTQSQTPNNVVLQQCAFGQAFSQWYPSDTYSTTILASVKAALYPVTTSGSTRTSIEGDPLIPGSQKPFRYKWLLFSGAGTDVTAFDVTSIAGWFTPTDRAAIVVQINVLKKAIAASPLDTSLRNALLDIYYDLAVAEMQAVKPKLAALARHHLGLEVLPPDKFIIDKEIDTYVEIDTAFQAAIAQYCALFNTPFPDIDPSSFDSRIPFGTPMGQYLFRREQSSRNSTPSQYVGSGDARVVASGNSVTSGSNVVTVDSTIGLVQGMNVSGSGVPVGATIATIGVWVTPPLPEEPVYHSNKYELSAVATLTGSPELTYSRVGDSLGVHEVPDIDGSGQPVVRPSGQILFAGYKDLNALLQIAGQRMQHLASQVELRGIRQGPGDIALGRQALTEAAGADNTDLQLIKSWFPEVFPPDLNALSPAERTAAELLQQQSGVFGALSALEAARIDLLKLTPFLNGSVNMLGYDPEFLLLVKSNQIPPLDSYDTLRGMLKGSNQPLQVALNSLNGTPGVMPPDGARYLYQNFQEKAETVAEDIDNANTALDARFLAITGYARDANPGFDKETMIPNPDPLVPTELRGVLATIQSLTEQAAVREDVTANFNDLLAESADKTKAGYALQSITLAQDQEQALNGVVNTYTDKTGSLYDANTAAKTVAATSQAFSEGVQAAAGSNNPFAAGVSIGSGAVNAAIQGASAGIVADNEKHIDFAGATMSAGIEGTNVPNAVNQARVDLAGLQRDQIANNIAVKSDTMALAQAVAKRTSLVAELERIEKERDTSVASIRKKSYADPLHYHRAEAALIHADESFRTAQRWMFYTLQALNYKWHGKFAITQGSKSYDSSTLFKCRNADELDDLLSQMVLWEAKRASDYPLSSTKFTKISLRDHVLARNPRRYDQVDPDDPDIRVDDTANPPTAPLSSLPTIQYFRKLLEANYKEPVSGDLVIPISTAFSNSLADRLDGNFFRGATYNTAGVCTDQGFWREKIDAVYVNIVAEGGTSPPTGISGVLTYGGTSYFHTRVPPRSDRTWMPQPGVLGDHPGELMMAPFRIWESPNLTGDFVPRFQQVQPINIAYNEFTGFIDGSSGVEDEMTNFETLNFAGRSIAASGWTLRIYRTSGIGFIDAANIKDIEIIISYRHSTRTFPF